MFHRLGVRMAQSRACPAGVSSASRSHAPSRGREGLDPRAAPPDGFAIGSRGGALFIVGGDARGALYGVYDLLEADLSVRWFMLGELGEDMPRSETLY